MTFSRRHRFAPDASSAPILNDAPGWLRLEYWSQVLEHRLCVEDRTSPQEPNRILGTKDLHSAFCSLIRAEPDPKYMQSWCCRDELRDHLLECEWYEFFDFVELAWRKLRDNPRQSPLERSVHSREYRDAVNAFFSASAVEWRLSDIGELTRVLGSALAEVLSSGKNAVADQPEARRLLDKAIGFLSSRSLDPDNAVKEAVSAVESFARSQYPGETTLGRVLARLRKGDSFPRLTISVMERVWEYSNSESGVRHGGVDPSSVSQPDADFFAHVCAAFIVRLAAHKK